MDSEYSQAKYSQKEALYHSTKQEPLGRSYVRGHVLPGKTTENDFKFGKASVSSTEAAKPLLYPTVTEDDQQYKAQYIKSHKSYAPGEQKQRDYNWKIDMGTHKFGVGVGSQTAMNGASFGVTGAMAQCEPPRITSKKTEDFKNTHDQLGRVRNLGHGSKESHPGVYGKASLPNSKVWDARSCIEGDYTYDEQAPDADLGKSHTPGFRNITAESRAFGVPTVRSDIPKYATRSIADNQNYGDDVNAQYLLYPPQFAAMGLEDTAFTGSLPKEEVISIFRESGCCDGLSEAEIEAVWETAKQDTRGSVSVRAFQAALSDLMEARR
mmetsp:Transcript_33161/g.87567  ORF Transcript_33161/g.87567 Transcript_33161/m.87567 type:complete len:324 (-) Transcript_33161:201-1172(-)